ncbi:DUF4142 domain-containing protein [Sphingopyxis terrae]|uniref:Putative membrane protein n=1 Tax=Sphingopyxis terrae subsp. ummariensis TaxID=429001 RepID=A0A1Y6FTN8_9SPHN|nr:DUF4142 domain-containing protein [Sphingopyxis terrae]PCF91336.1 DUF4142 domain-containing protein [Sphingopyxis terrae subsp. ummariensis]SMQ76510.1 putative membrane protein [Sphingopyxis terrae subsp. ummariensis]
MTRRFALSIATCLLLAACDAPERDPADARAADAANAPMMAAAGDTADQFPASSIDPQIFVDRVGASNSYEIDAARIALERTRSNAIRDFANRMIRDHGSAADKLEAAVKAHGNGVTFRPRLSAQDEADLAALREARDFDGLYLDQQRRAHEKALALLRGYANGKDSGALRSFAAEAAEMVEAHFDAVGELENGAREEAG